MRRLKTSEKLRFQYYQEIWGAPILWGDTLMNPHSKSTRSFSKGMQDLVITCIKHPDGGEILQNTLYFRKYSSSFSHGLSIVQNTEKGAVQVQNIWTSLTFDQGQGQPLWTPLNFTGSKTEHKSTPGADLKPTKYISQMPPKCLSNDANIQVRSLFPRDEAGSNLTSVFPLQIPGTIYLLCSMQLCSL